MNSFLQSHNENGCPFCDIPQESVLVFNQYACVVRDAFPVTELHTLIIPHRHVKSYFDLTMSVVEAVHELLCSQRRKIEALDSTVTGFNIGINCGEDSGQTVFHCHIHLMPRRKGDVTAPRGGIRHIIPGKGDYLSNRN